MTLRYIPKHQRYNKLPHKYKYKAATAIFTEEQFRDYSEIERESAYTFLNQFIKNERLIIFCHFKLKWGRKKIRRLTGLSERLIRKTIYKVKQTA